MDQITVITPPDKLFNSTPALLVITPNSNIKIKIHDFVSSYPNKLNVYFYEESDSNIEWVLSVIQLVECVIFDLDNAGPDLRNFSSYIISKSNVFYLTNDAITPYNLISNNRVYDLNFLSNIFNGEQ
jgi:hypothetical protein